MQNVLETKNIVKIYGNKDNTTYAVNGIDFTVKEGEFVGIMGPSGSGKTTLLNMLGGIDKPSSGSINIMGKHIDELDKDDLALYRRRHLGFIFQEFNLLDSLTLKENIMLPMILDQCSGAKMEARAKEIMSFFGIYEIGDKYPYHVSGGQKQRAAASRALMNNPSIVLADEPTGNLDSKSSNSIMETLHRMNEEMKSTILMVTHDPFAASFCNRIIFIKDGVIEMEVVKKGTRTQFFDQILDCEAILGGDRREV